ncbi:hypothetical protein [Streptomyces sp. ISL-1]|nr:hypothetical protein [Streptomyces sp. ISL-1]
MSSNEQNQEKITTLGAHHAPAPPTDGTLTTMDHHAPAPPKG